MTDVKGDRSKRPSEQADPDLFVHVIEHQPDGIIVRGLKRTRPALYSHTDYRHANLVVARRRQGYALSLLSDKHTRRHSYVGRQPSDTAKWKAFRLTSATHNLVGMKHCDL